MCVGSCFDATCVISGNYKQTQIILIFRPISVSVKSPYVYYDNVDLYQHCLPIIFPHTIYSNTYTGFTFAYSLFSIQINVVQQYQNHSVLGNVFTTMLSPPQLSNLKSFTPSNTIKAYPCLSSQVCIHFVDIPTLLALLRLMSKYQINCYLRSHFDNKRL